MSLGPFDLTGGPFLALYTVLLILTVVAGIVIPHWLRPEGRLARITDTGQLAYLAGGLSRFADAVVMRLLAVRALAINGKQKFHAVVRDAGRSPAERSVLALPGEIGWPLIERSLKSYAPTVEQDLVAAGLLMDRGLTLQMRFWQTLPYFLLLLFGGTKWMVGVARDRPVGFLTMLLVLTAILALVRWFSVDRRTLGGHTMLDKARAEAQRLRRAPTATETDVAVALFGTSVLVGSSWADFHQLRTASSGDSGSGGSSDGGSSGCGGGGGGCGGCGS